MLSRQILKIYPLLGHGKPVTCTGQQIQLGWPVQKSQAQYQHTCRSPMLWLHGRINTSRKLQHWFAQSYTACEHTVSSRVQISRQESPGRNKITTVKDTCTRLTLQRSLKGMPLSYVLILFHHVFQFMEFKCLQFRLSFTREIPAFKTRLADLGKVLKVSFRVVFH